MQQIIWPHEVPAHALHQALPEFGRMASAVEEEATVPGDTVASSWLRNSRLYFASNSVSAVPSQQALSKVCT